MASDAQTDRATPALKLAIAPGPECPHCHEDGFDDWFHEPNLKSVCGTLTRRLRCHGCGKFFSVTHYSDGQTHSMAWSKAA